MTVSLAPSSHEHLLRTFSCRGRRRGFRISRSGGNTGFWFGVRRSRFLAGIPQKQANASIPSPRCRHPGLRHRGDAFVSPALESLVGPGVKVSTGPLPSSRSRCRLPPLPRYRSARPKPRRHPAQGTAGRAEHPLAARSEQPRNVRREIGLAARSRTVRHLGHRWARMVPN